MAFKNPGATNSHLVERAVSRLSEDAPLSMAQGQKANAAALVNYLVTSGVTNEDDLVELALLAKGKRYDPADGSFT